MRRPPQQSLLSEPIEITGAFGASAAIDGGGGAASAMSTSDSSSRIGQVGVRGQPRDLAPRALRQRGAGRVVEGRREVQQARGTLAQRLAQRVGPHAVGPDVERRQRRARRAQSIERAQERRALDQGAVVAAQEERAHQRDRLLRAARDHDLALRGGQAAPLEVARDRAAQRGQAQRAVAVVARGFAAASLAGLLHALLDQAGQRRQAGAGQVDRARPRA